MIKKRQPGKRASGLFSVEPVFLRFLGSDPKAANGLYADLEFPKNAVFSFRHQNREGFYFVKKGLVKLEILHPNPRILRLCLPGDLAGFGNWLAPNSSTYQLKALADCSVQFWTKEGFEKLRAKSAEVNQLLIYHLISVIHHKDDRIAALESLSVKSRVAHLLSWMAKGYGAKAQDGILIDLEIDRDSMAQLAGTVPATLARVLTLFEIDGLIRRVKRKILILNAEGLKKKSA